MSINWRTQVKKDFEKMGAKASKALTTASKRAFKVAISTPPTPVDTGTLRAAWRFTTGRKQSHSLKYNRKNKRYLRKPSMPKISVSATKHNSIAFYNNMHYADFVDKGQGPGTRTPANMLRAIKREFVNTLKREIR